MPRIATAELDEQRHASIAYGAGPDPRLVDQYESARAQLPSKRRTLKKAVGRKRARRKKKRRSSQSEVNPWALVSGGLLALLVISNMGGK